MPKTEPSDDDSGNQIMKGSCFPFTTIIVTNPDEASARSAQKLLDSTLKRYLNSRSTEQDDASDFTREIRIISTCDPFGARCGSFGGTLAALELIEDRKNDAKRGNTDDGGGDDSVETVLCLHAGGDSSRCPLSMILGKAWTNLPSSEYRNPITWLIKQLEDLFYRAQIPRGSLLIAATDCLISLEQPTDLPNSTSDTRIEDPPFSSACSMDPSLVLGVAVPAPLTTATNHGVFVMPRTTIPHSTIKTSSTSKTFKIESPEDVWQKPSVEKLMSNVLQDGTISIDGLAPTCFDVPKRSGKQAWIDVGIVIFFPKAFETIIKLSKNLLKLCTRKGLEDAYRTRTEDDGEAKNDSDSVPMSLELFAKKNALKVDLYTHILHNLPFRSKTNLNGEKVPVATKYPGENMEDSLRHFLSGMSLKVLVVPEGCFLHLGTNQEMVEFITTTSNGIAPNDYNASNVSRKVPAIMDQYVTKSLAKALLLESRFQTFPSLDNDATTHGCAKSTAMFSIFPGESSETKLGIDSVVEYSDLQCYDSVSIGDHCMLSGWRRQTKELSKSDQGESSLRIPDALSVQLLPLVSKREKNSTDNAFDTDFAEAWVMLVVGTTDSIKTPITNSNVYGVPFSDFCKRTRISMEQIGFQDGASGNESLWTAKLHPIVRKINPCDPISFSALFGWIEKLRDGRPSLTSDQSFTCWITTERVSLKQIHDIADASTEWSFRLSLEKRILELKSKHPLECMIGLLKERSQDKPCDLRWLEKIKDSEEFNATLYETINSLEQLALEEFAMKNFDISGRSLMLASAVMAKFSDDSEEHNVATVGIATDKNTGSCLDLIKELKMTQAVESQIQIMTKIFRIRKSGVSYADVYEILAFHMIELTISEGFRRFHDPSSPSAFRFKRIGEAIRDKFVLSVAPVRVDLAGGWSDTPPIAYEFGGSVSGMAVLVDGYFPLSCRCRLLPGKTGILLKTELRSTSNGLLLSSSDEEVMDISQIAGFRDPQSKCSLLKAALVCLGMVTEDEILHSSDIQRLLNKFCLSTGNVRMEIITTSLLGMGTGMGSSSILGACVIQALAVCVGIGKIDDEVMIHAVLVLEQLLSSGGGWQDQAHGIVPGIKTVTSAPTIPLQIKITPIELSSGSQSSFDSRLLLAFTGKTRLAKNILQHVLRRWARRTSEIVGTIDNLVKSSSAVRDAFLCESWDSVGENMYRAHRLKCDMAGEKSGAEPESVKVFVTALASHGQIKGAMLCGAGGGGFLLLLLSPGVCRKDIEDVFENSIRPLSEDFKDYSFHSCRISNSGLTTSVIHDSSLDVNTYKLAWQCYERT